MIVIQLMWADFKRVWLASLTIILLIASIIAFGLFLTLEERALREGSARAAQQFDLVIGAVGSDTQLVLSTVYLQPTSLPLLSGHYLSQLENDPLVRWAAPLALGDSYAGHPMVGTTATLLLEDNTLLLSQGKTFSAQDEAVIGANVALNIGDEFSPLHGLEAQPGTHHHDEIRYRVVGKLPLRSNVWDNAIFVPIEAVWSTHDLDPNENEAHHSSVTPENQTGINSPHTPQSPPISAIIVKPNSFAGAYQLRSQYKTAETQAVFPAEVLTRLYGTLGNIHALLNKISLGSQIVTALILIMMAFIYLNSKKQQIAILRAFGANRRRILIYIWLSFIFVVMIGVVLGIVLGYLSAVVVAHSVAQSQGFPLPVTLTIDDLYALGGLLLMLSVVLLIPARMSYRYTVANSFRQ